MLLLETPPQISTGLTITLGFAVLSKMLFVAAMSRRSCGRADHSKATTPTAAFPALVITFFRFWQPLLCCRLA